MSAVVSEAPAAERLARFYAALMAPSLPEATRHAVRRHLLDTLGAALAGSAQPEPQAALRASNLLHNAPGIAAIWGASHRASPEVAAIVNGTAAHALELDDASGCDHSGAVVERTLRIDVPIGSWNRPLPDAELVAKYRSLATPVLGEARAAALESAVMGLRRGADVAALPDLLTTPDGRGRLA